MKMRIMILALLLTGVSHGFASPTDGIGQKVAASFKKDFKMAEDVRWEDKKEYLVATFSMNGDIVFAYYKTDGDLIAVARNILSDKLPLSLSLTFRQQYGSCWITQLFEVSAHDETTYYMTLQNADHQIKLKSTGGDWEAYERTEKK